MKEPRRSEPAETVSSRERLLGAAKRLIADVGYERVSTATIAREAGSSESQLVRYFGSKAGLLEAIFNASWAPLIPRIVRLVSAAPTARDAMITVLSTMIGAFHRDPELAKLFLFEGRRVRGESAEILLTQGYREFARLVMSLIERGQREGSFNPSLKVQVMGSALLGAAEGMIRDRMLAVQHNQPAALPETQVRAVFEALISGLGPRSASDTASPGAGAEP